MNIMLKKIYYSLQKHLSQIHLEDGHENLEENKRNLKLLLMKECYIFL